MNILCNLLYLFAVSMRTAMFFVPQYKYSDILSMEMIVATKHSAFTLHQKINIELIFMLLG